MNIILIKIKNIFISTTTFGQFSKAPLRLLTENNFKFVFNDKNRKEGVIKERCAKKSDQFVSNAKKKLIESIKSDENNRSEIIIKKLEKKLGIKI